MIPVLVPSQYESMALNHQKIQDAGGAVYSFGMGKVKTMLGCHILARGYSKHMVLTGFAGTLNSNLKRGDIIEPKVLIEKDFDARPLSSEVHYIERQRGGDPGSIDCIMHTRDRFITSQDCEMEADAHKDDFLACDMESYAFAYFCSNTSIPYTIIKVISDGAGLDAEKEFRESCKEYGKMLTDLIVKTVRRIS